MIGRPALQRRTGCAQVEAQARFVAGDASTAEEVMGGLSHVHGPETAGRVSRGGMAGAAVRSGQDRNVRGGERRGFRRIVVVVEAKLREAVALRAIARDA